MTSNKKYPEVNYPEVFAFQTIFMNIKKDPTYIDESPYTEAVKTGLKSMFCRVKDAESKIKKEDLVELDLEEETNLVYTRTKQLMDRPLEPNEELAILKNATGMLEKLLAMAERTKNLRYIRDLEQKIIKIARTLPENDRNELLNMLKE